MSRSWSAVLGIGRDGAASACWEKWARRVVGGAWAMPTARALVVFLPLLLMAYAGDSEKTVAGEAAAEGVGTGERYVEEIELSWN